jgi:hypothetical protein
MTRNLLICAAFAAGCLAAGMIPSSAPPDHNQADVSPTKEVVQIAREQAEGPSR